MDNQRLFLIVGLAFVSLLLFQAWQQDYGPRPVTAPATTQTAQPTAGEALQDTPVAQALPSTSADIPSAPAPAQAVDKPGDLQGSSMKTLQRVRVKTDIFNIEIDTLGGDLRQVELRQYPISQEHKEIPFRLMSDQDGMRYVAQSGFVVSQGKGPDHYGEYRAEQTLFSMKQGQDELRVPLYWEDESGIRVTKTYIFHRGSHTIDIEHKVENSSQQEWQGSYYRQFQRTQSDEGGGGMGMVYTYTGGVIYTPEELFEKVNFDDIEEQRLNRQNVEGGWIAMMQHYFVSAMVPAADTTNTFYSRYHNMGYILGMLTPLEKVAPGTEKSFGDKLYAGPKLQDDLETLSPGLDLTVDYGVLTVIAKPLYWVLQFFHGLTGNWGFAIIFLTLSVKLLFYKLSETSYRSMANMRKLQPRMQTLKERFGDDRQGMQQAMMKMYKEEKINPLGGCLPILVQIPVFIALYWVLLESVEMRQAPFIFWLQDLSAQDPYYVLPLLMGISMFVQQKLNPAPIDPMQAKIMSALPVVFTVFFIFFPSGLVLYWVVNNILSIAQQWLITRRVESGKDKKKQ